MEFKSENRLETQALAARILNELPADARVVLFDAEMGAGKTTLITDIMKEMGVEDHVSSPTFSIVNEYFSEKYGVIYHCDFYRLEDEEEAYDIGVDELLEGDSYVFIEWGERISNLLPEKCVTVSINLENEVRIIKLDL